MTEDNQSMPPDQVDPLDLHPADLADYVQRLPPDEAQAFFESLPRPKAAAVLVEMDRDHILEVLDTLTPDELVGMMRELPPHQVADVVGELDLNESQEILAELPPDQALQVQSLLRYPEDTAGGIMNDRFIALRADATVGECHELLRTRNEQRPEDVSYLYVTDEKKKLVGVVPIRDLVFRSPQTPIRDIMRREVATVQVDADQEEIARTFEHYHYLGLPVLDRLGRLVGVVKASDALHVAQAEATEDMQLMVGLSGEERALTPWSKSLGKRLPWLYVNLATAFLAAIVVSFFEETIAEYAALAVFLPIVAGQGGNAGMQTLTVIIRDLALGELSPGDGRRALAKELILGLINGAAIGLVVGLIGYLWKGSPMLGVVAGLAMVFNQLAAALSGVMIPFGLKWMKVDPALASSIFLTTVTDVAGFFVFLGLAAIALRMAMF